MASQAPTPADAEAAKSRILSHMNKDHPDSLALYLAHSQNINPTSLSPQMTDISFENISIALNPNGRVVKVPIEPPLASWMEARGKLETMDKEARSALGRDRVRVKRFVPPTTPIGIAWVLFLALFFATFWRRGNFVPGAGVYDTAGLSHVPAFGRLCYNAQPYAFWFAVIMHVGETAWVIRGRLRKWNVDLGPSWVWWAWVLDTAFEGGPAFLRFDEEVKRLEEGGKKEH